MITAMNRLISRFGSDIAATATWCAVVEPDGTFRVIASSGLSAGVEVLDARSTPCAQVVERNGSVVIEDVVLEPAWADRRHESDASAAVAWSSYVGLPMTDGDGVAFGVVAAACTSARTWSNDDLERVADLATIASRLIAVQREMEHQRRRLDRERDARNLRREMYELARSTSSTDSRDQIALALARGAGQVLEARLSVLALPIDDRIHFVHGQGVPEALADLWAPVDQSAQVPLVRCIVSGQPIELSTQDAIDEWPLLASVAARSGVSAFFAFPITDESGEVIAGLGIGLERAGTLTMAQRLVIEELLVDTARALHRSGRAEFVAGIARELQKSLLPPSLPGVNGIDVYALSESSANGTPIGGDWYDVVPITDTITGFIVGDATGHDVRSAAMMGQVRHVVASQLRDHHSPATALRNSDGYFAGLHENVLATVVIMLVDLSSNTVVVSSAGHPPPIAVDGDGARLLDLKPGGPVGSGFGGMTDATTPLGESVTLIAISDGVYERRGGDIVTQLDLLVAEIDAVGLDRDKLRALLRYRVSADTVDDATALVVTIRAPRAYAPRRA
jgi:serine phosphatase RsbU (regulator of sigma subunit)